MTLSRDWYTRANVPLADISTAAQLAKATLWGWKAALKNELVTGTEGPEGPRPAGSNWTCAGSSDSVSANMTGTDLWGPTFDGTKIVRNTAGNAHSWIVLQSPAALGPFYICIDYSTSSTTQINITASKTPFTGGSNTTAPTSANSFTLGTNQNFCENTSGVNHNLHITVDDNGNYWFLVSKTGSGIFNFTNFGSQCVENRVLDECNFFAGIHFQSSARGTPTTGSVTVAGRNWNNTATMTGGIQVFQFGGVQFSGTATVNGIDGKWDVLPLYVYTSNSLTGGIRGRFPDVGIVGIPPVGSSDPSTSAQERVVAGDFLIPCSVVPVL